MGPQYLNEMFNFVNFNHFIHLAEPRVNSSYHDSGYNGDRSFQKVGPNLYNNLQALYLKSCSSLESFNFKLAFDIAR